MHPLLVKQLKSLGITPEETFITREQLQRLLVQIDATYEKSQEQEQLLHDQTPYKREMTGSEGDSLLNAFSKSFKHHYIFYTYDTEGNLTYISDSLHSILGYEPEAFLHHYRDYLTDDPINSHIQKWMKKVLQGGEVEPYIVSVYHRNGGVRYLELTEVAMENSLGNPVLVGGIARDVTSQCEAQEALDKVAMHDTLTGILNRYSFYQEIEKALKVAKKYQERVTLLFIDLDHFKEVNDQYGHHIGDELLGIVVERIEHILRKNDIFARLGGDEFIVVLSNVAEENVIKVTEKILETIRKPYRVKGHELRISGSIGIATYPEDAIVSKKLIRAADRAMYQAKDAGRDCYRKAGNQGAYSGFNYTLTNHRV